jgi:hypothetical protein
MGVQTARSSTVARPFMRLKPQNIAVQVPLNPADAEVRVLLPCQGLDVEVSCRAYGSDRTLRCRCCSIPPTPR